MASLLEAIAAAASGISTGLMRTRERKRSDAREEAAARRAEEKLRIEYALGKQKNEVQERRYSDLDTQFSEREARLADRDKENAKLRSEATSMRETIEGMRNQHAITLANLMASLGGRDLEVDQPRTGSGSGPSNTSKIDKELIDSLQAIADRSGRLFNESRGLRLDRRYGYDPKFRATAEGVIKSDSLKSVGDENKLLRAIEGARGPDISGAMSETDSSLPPLPQAIDDEVNRRLSAAGVKPGSSDYVSLYKKAAEMYWLRNGGQAVIDKYRSEVGRR